MGRTLCSQGKFPLDRHSLGHLLIRTRCVVGRRLCSQGEYISNQRSLGHPLMADTVLWDVRCFIKGSAFVKWTFLGASPHGGRCVVGRTLCFEKLLCGRSAWPDEAVEEELGPELVA